MTTSDAYQEFLDENADRIWPFAEDSRVEDIAGIVSLPQGAILDARGFSRQRPDGPVRLCYLLGPEAVGSVGGFSAVPGHWLLIFRGHASLEFRFEASVDAISEAAVRLRSEVADPSFSDLRGVLMGALEITVGPDIALLNPASALDFGDSAPLEPATFACLHENFVDFIRVVPRDAAAFIVGGDVVLSGGYNMDVTQGEDGAISLVAARGAGKYGAYLESTSTGTPCAGAVTSLSSVAPTAEGEFQILGGPGVVVENFPEDHRIRITITPDQLRLKCQ